MLWIVHLFSRSGCELANWASLSVLLHLGEGESRVESRETEHSNCDHDAVQPDEIRLRLHNGIPPSFCHLGDTEDATCEDSGKGEGETKDEELEAEGLYEFDGGCGELVAALVSTKVVVGD